MLTPNHHLNSKHRNIMAILNRVGDRVLERIFVDAKIRRPLPGGPPFSLSPNPLPSTPKLHGTSSNSFQEFASRHPPTRRAFVFTSFGCQLTEMRASSTPVSSLQPKTHQSCVIPSPYPLPASSMGRGRGGGTLFSDICRLVLRVPHTRCAFQ